MNSSLLVYSKAIRSASKDFTVFGFAGIRLGDQSLSMTTFRLRKVQGNPHSLTVKVLNYLMEMATSGPYSYKKLSLNSVEVTRQLTNCPLVKYSKCLQELTLLASELRRTLHKMKDAWDTSGKIRRRISSLRQNDTEVRILRKKQLITRKSTTLQAFNP